MNKNDFVEIIDGNYKNRVGHLLQGTNLHGYYWVVIEGAGNKLIPLEFIRKLNPGQTILEHKEKT